MLTNKPNLLTVPGMGNLASAPPGFLDGLLNGVDSAIKKYVKRNLELQPLVEFHSGSLQRDIILKQYPILSAQTQIATASNGVSLPQSTLNVVSTAGFDPAGYISGNNPTLVVQTSLQTWTTCTYTGVTATTFTGCANWSGSGTLSSTALYNQVFSPAVWFDPAGFFGQSQGGFSDGTLVIQGSQQVTYLDSASQSGNTVSHRGLIRRIGGSAGQGSFLGFYPNDMYGGGKLAAYRMPIWPRGDGNIKVAYSNGYSPVPYDIVQAATMLAAQLVRIMPSGSNLSNESLGAYSYSVLVNGENPELGDIRRTLAGYRERSV